MAFNWQTFRTRTLTAIIFVAVMLTGLLWNQWSFLILFSIIHFGCWWEYLGLMEKIHQTIFHPYVKMGFMVIGYGLMLWFCGPAYHINNYGLKENLSLPVSAAGFALLLIGIFQKNAINPKGFGMTVVGLIYISLCWGLMMDISDERNHHIRILGEWPRIRASVFFPLIPIIIIVSIWINDTMAYIVGSLIGKTPLSKISPKKTWEGTLGGMILSIGIIGFLVTKMELGRWDYDVGIPYGKSMGYIMVAIIAVTGTFGDLLESKLKRMAKVKDSGTLMPGHGGFLDRFDSLLFAIPCVWIFLNFFGS